MRAIRKKMQSQRGASITFALLLFLVCAVLSAVIVVASTTSAGRMSKLPETDQRYFAVTSAAELLKDLMKEPVTFIKQIETTEVTTQTITMSGGTTEVNTSKGPEEKITTEYLIAKDKSAIAENDLQFESPITDGLGLPLAKDAAYRHVKEQLLDNRKLSLTTSPLYSELAVTAIEKIDRNRITFRVFSTADDRYELKLIFDAETDTEIRPTETLRDETAPPTETTDGETTTRTITRTVVRKDETRTTVTWKLSSIQTSLTPTA